jgi:hypothetical protein
MMPMVRLPDRIHIFILCMVVLSVLSSFRMTCQAEEAGGRIGGHAKDEHVSVIRKGAI